jgi:hypothetical protein
MSLLKSFFVVKRGSEYTDSQEMQFFTAFWSVKHRFRTNPYVIISHLVVDP